MWKPTIVSRAAVIIISTSLLCFLSVASRAGDLPAIPDRLVVLTFDDGSKSDVNFVAPLLKRYGFGATFFVCRDTLAKNKNAMVWEEVCKLNEAGFEIGNHACRHLNCGRLSRQEFLANLECMELLLKEHGIPMPKTFCYPGYHTSQDAAEVLSDKGYLFARRGCEPVSPFGGYQKGGRGPAYDPQYHHPLLVPTTGASGPKWTFDDFVWAVNQARDGRVGVLTFHGVPDRRYRHCSTEPAMFERCMNYLRDNGYTVIGLRDLAKYIDPISSLAEPFEHEQTHPRDGVRPSELTCEYAINPLGIDVAQPRLSWILKSNTRGQMQSAYQILVARNEEELTQNKGDLWDSGKVISDRSVNVAYKGKALKSAQKCYWKVRCWEKYNNPGPWSDTGTFETGLLREVDWQGKWIGADKSISAPLLRKEFGIDKEVERASVYVCGLGFYEVYINGEKVGDHVLDPATTYYNNDIPLELNDRVLYVSYDVTNHLKTGRNGIGVMLGNGWYSAEADIPGPPSHRAPYGDRPVLILQMCIEFTDGEFMSIATDDTWKASSGPITYNDYCNGEAYDARLEKPGWSSPGYDDSDWRTAVFVEAPGGVPTSQMLPPTKVVKTIKPVRITEPKAGVYVYDFGQHFSGWTKLHVSGQRGAQVTLRHAGRVHDDGTLDARNNLHPKHIARQTDTYILKGEGREVWEPRFTLHGFRYAEVSGFPGKPTLENLEGRFVHSAVETTGSFTCSNSLINQIHRNVCWTFLSSLQGIPQDAADRAERLSWLGDVGFVGEDYIYNFDMAGFWSKWVRDIKDSQKPNGDVPVVCPLHWRSKNPPYGLLPAWKSTYPILIWYVHWYYGDQRILEEHYDGMKRLLDFLGSKARGHILRAGLGDHMEPQPNGSCSSRPRHTPRSLSSTAYYYYDAWILSQAANILGKAEEARRYSRLAGDIRNAFNKEFLDGETNQYGTGSQTSNALPLYLGMVPHGKEKAVTENLYRDIMVKHSGRLSTGILGTNALEQALPEYGLADVMYTIATQTTFPSWGHQIQKGATTIWETWNYSNVYSLNMKMFGSTEKFFYKDLAGISPAGSGYRHIVVKPRVVGDLKYAKASIKTVRGLAAVGWRKGEKSFEMQVTIPVNSRAEVHVPKMGFDDVVIAEGQGTVWQAGKFVKGVDGISGGGETTDYVTLDVGSGDYAFVLRAQ
ncbi:MAG: family 78 glycoside hydrolase catalytic domain [Phycisphaerales bacterium]|nr:MAG: family 78 glycoside hydrolase catalytic domain [Phycisphaerales bacterium]